MEIGLMTSIRHMILAALVLLSVPTIGHAEVATRVYLNGVPTAVYFNDGDSFRVLAGPYKGTRARTAGFNTLESYGPVHMWGSWTAHELSHYASKGTLNARRGTWNCKSDGSRDGYGRMLWDCLDLAIEQVQKGLAHAMTVTLEGAHPAIQKAQRDAIVNRRGMWAHGVPSFVMTSLHSADERSSGTGYNRNVASSDGHSEKQKHTDIYEECQYVCQPAQDVDDAKVTAFAASLQKNADLASVLSEYDAAAVNTMVSEFARTGIATRFKTSSHRVAVESILAKAQAVGMFSKTSTPLACMIYVKFQRRYGAEKAACLR
jgi:endonuclease YncB( thermonuclease family)